MALIDALTDTCSMSSVTYSTDAMGQETKTITPLYATVPCRMHRGTIRPRIVPDQGSFQPKSEPWTMITTMDYAGGQRGDRVIWNSQTFFITIAQVVRGPSGSNHMAYSIDEQL